MAQDLRSFLDEIKRRWPDELQVVSRPVDPAYEITALVVKLERGSNTSFLKTNGSTVIASGAVVMV